MALVQLLVLFGELAMSTVTSLQTTRDLLIAWRSQMRRRLHQPTHVGARDVIGMSYLTHGSACRGLIAVDRLVLVVLHDEEIVDQRMAIQLAGVSGRVAEWGVQFDRERFFKNLNWVPDEKKGGGFQRLPLNPELLDLGLRLDQFVNLHARFRDRMLADSPVLPPLWAALRRSDATPQSLDGPEWRAVCQEAGKTSESLLRQFARNYRRLRLLPLEWVSEHWRRFVDVFADLTDFPRMQAFSPSSMPDGLRGFAGAAAYDFTMPQARSRIRSLRCRRSGMASGMPAAGGTVLVA